MSYFHFHSPELTIDGKLKSMQCEAFKESGHQCQNKTVIGLDFCHIHRKFN